MKNIGIWPIIFALSTGLFWGSYAPVLAQARTYEKSPFKPYVMIGVAYVIWAIIGGIAGMVYKGDSFAFTSKGVTWGFAAGTLGAWGALTLTLAMFSGGSARPEIVTPIVFGTAVSVIAIISVFTTKTHVDFRLWLGIIGMIICIVTVTYYTPQAPHAPAPAMTPPVPVIPTESGVGEHK